MTAPIPKDTKPHEPFPAAMREQMAQWIISQGGNTGWSIPENIKAQLPAIAKDGAQHGVSDDALWLYYFLAGTSGTVPTPGVDQAMAVSQFIGKLSNGALWTRVAQFAVGGVLIGVGVNALFKGKPAAIAGKAAKGAMIL